MKEIHIKILCALAMVILFFLAIELDKLETPKNQVMVEGHIYELKY